MLFIENKQIIFPISSKLIVSHKNEIIYKLKVSATPIIKFPISMFPV